MKRNPPFSIELKSGEITGLYADFWRLWSHHNQREIKFRASDFLENLDDLKNSRVDFHGGLFKSEERKEWADFSLPIHEVKTGVYFYDRYQKAKELSQLSGKKLAVPEGSLQSEFVAKNFPKIELVTFVDNEKIISEILNGKIDGIIAEEPFIDSLLSSLGIKGILSKSTETVMTEKVFALIPKGNESVTEEINRGIKNIPIDEIVKLENQWLPNHIPFYSNYINLQIPQLNLREIEIIQNAPPLTIGSDPDWRPIEFMDNDDRYMGISSEYFKFLKNSTNLSFNKRIRLRWELMLERAQKGEIDLITTITRTKLRDEFLLFSNPYLSFPVAIITRKNERQITSLKDIKDKTLALIPDGSLEESVQELVPNQAYEKVDTIISALNQLKSKNIDAFVGNYFLLKFYLSQKRYEGLKVVNFAPFNVDISMALSKKHKNLMPVINKSLSQISNRERVSILNKWRREEVKINDELNTFLYWLTPISFILLSVFIYIFFTNRQMVKVIKERDKTQERLRKERYIADSANRGKDEFFANMSHELRTPMNSVVGMSQLLKMTSMTDEQKEYVNTINQSSKNLLELINDILDLSKIEASKLSLEVIPFNPNKLVQELVSNLSTPEEIEFHSKLDEKLNVMVLGDPFRLRQILNNLISNAIKFTKKGSITLRVDSRFDEKNKTLSQPYDKYFEIQFSVIDSGIGMSSTQVQGLFLSFNQVDSDNTRQYGGAGLGLKLSNQLCQLMNGKIEVRSEIGKGSDFKVTIPFRVESIEFIPEKNTDENKNKYKYSESETEASLESRTKILKGKRILVVDDNPVNLIVAKRIIEKYGMSVLSTDNGFKAIELLLSEPFDLVLMDIQMPVMDGYDTTKKIKKESRLEAIPILALTASVGFEEKEKIEQCGMLDCIEKPIEIEKLLNALLKHLNIKGSEK